MPRYLGFSDEVLQYNMRFTIDDAELHVKTFENAYVYPAEITSGGLLTDLGGGAFDSEGTFIEASAQPRSDEQAAIMTGQAAKPIGGNYDIIDEAVYGGILLDHFGHFLLESNSRTWAQRSLINKTWIFIVPPTIVLKKYHFDYLSMMGIPETSILIIREPARIRKLHIPDRAIVYHSWVNKNFIEPFFQTKIDTTWKPGRYYLSRAHLDAAVSVGEAEFVEELSFNSWNIIRSEELTPSEQVALFRSGSVIMGVQGSAFHNSLFNSKKQQLIQICRSNAQRSYFMLDTLSGADPIYINGTISHPLTPHGASGPFLLDIDTVMHHLKREGLLSKTKSGWKRTSAEYSKIVRLYEGWWYHQEYLERLYLPASISSTPDLVLSNSELIQKAAKLAPDVSRIRQSAVTDAISIVGYKAARPDILQALLDFPNQAVFYYLISLAESEAGEMGTAIVFAKKGLSLAPREILYNNHLAAMYVRIEDHDSAEKIIRNCVENGIADSITYYLMSLVCEKQTGTPNIEAAKTAHTISPKNIEIRRHYALSLFRTGGHEDLMRLINNNREWLESDGVMAYIASMSLRDAGDLDAALTYAELACKLEVDNMTIKANRDDIFDTIYSRNHQ